MDDLHQDKITKLEEELLATSNELVRVKTEKAALQLKGISKISGDVEELAVLRQELKKEQEKLAETEEKIGNLDNLERIITQQQDEISKLSTLKNSLKLKLLSQEPKNDDAINELQAKLTEAEEEIAQLKLNIVDKPGDNNNIVQGLEVQLAEAKSAIELLNETNSKLILENEELKKEIILLKEAAPLEIEKSQSVEQNMEDNNTNNAAPIEISEEAPPVPPKEEASLTEVPKEEIIIEAEQPASQFVPEQAKDINQSTQVKDREQTLKSFKSKSNNTLPDDVMQKWLGG